jgi:uncharacterized protein YcaQ
METLDLAAVRRLALARAGLAPTAWSGLPTTARGAGRTARDAAHAVIGRFGYLQLDTISVAGARSHALVLLSRLEGMSPALGEDLLVPGAPFFEYWGHEASWMPLAQYPLFRFRRERFRKHPWWGDIITPRRAAADALLQRARDQGGFRSSDLEGDAGGGFWRGKEAKRVAEALYSSGDLAIRERRGFQRTYDLPERVIPEDLRRAEVSSHDAHRALILLACDGHGWAETRTLAATWRLRPRSAEFVAALQSLADEGAIVPCSLAGADGVAGGSAGRRAAAPLPGWIRPRDLDLAARLRRWRPRADRGVLLSPFDPVLWDRPRLLRLFGFHLRVEIYTPAPKRRYGYFCMPVLAGDRLVGRVDVKADRAAGVLRAVACHYEAPGRRPPAADREAVRTAIERHASALGLDVE